MIERYSLPEMTKVWTEDTRFGYWLKIETLALEKMAELGLAPTQSYKAVKEKGTFNSAKVLDIEKVVKHDVIAFLTNVAESVGEDSRYMHRGMTSSDVLDTALACQFKDAGDLIIKKIDTLLEVLKERAYEHKLTVCIGRSHGIHAEPITFGLKLASWYAEVQRHKQRLQNALEDVCVGKVSGAVGTYAFVPPAIEEHVLKQLGLGIETVSSQIVQRDRHAVFFNALAQVASSIDKFAVEVRHLQRTEVNEASEYFSMGQKGSSAMPHKKNPVLSENLSGLARLIRGYAVAAMENVALWHERDISHSSVERIAGPDACILLDFMLHRFTGLVKQMIVNKDRMLENLESSKGLVFSGTLLNMLVDKGITREAAYSLVQSHALQTWQGGAGLYERVKEDPEINKLLSKEEVLSAFDMQRHTAHVDYIFKRCFGQN